MSCAANRQALLQPETLPGRFQHAPAAPADPAPAGYSPVQSWLTGLHVPALQPLVTRALQQNYSLAQQAAAVEIARTRASVLLADRLPALDLQLAARRQRPFTDGDVDDQFDIGATLGLQSDLNNETSGARTG